MRMDGAVAEGREGEAVELLRALVRVNSVNRRCGGPGEKEAGRVAGEWARGRGLRVRFLPVKGEAPNVLVTGEGFRGEREGRRIVLLEAHLDTVGVEGMRGEPWGAEAQGGRVFGRGSCDTKAAAAAMLWALAEVAREQPDVPGAVLLTVDEEVGKAGVRAFVDRQMGRLGWRPAWAVVGEPTGLRPVVAHNGALRWGLVTRGVAAHSSNPGAGRSAISAMARVILELEREYLGKLEGRHPLTGRAVGSINVVRGGRQVNMVPDRCVAVMERRLLPGERAQEVLAVVEGHLERLRSGEGGVVVERGKVKYDPPLDGGQPAWVLARVREALEACGLRAEVCGMPYGTDAANLAGAGVPAVVLGPGDIAQAHTAEEWVEVEQVRLACGVFAEVLRRAGDGG